MERKDYIEELKKGLEDLIEEEGIDLCGEDADDEAERLREDAWIDDHVTGNGSGSYTFSRERARENLKGNEDLVGEMADAFGIGCEEIGRRFMAGDWESLDVMVRCYLLDEAIESLREDLRA